MDIVSRELYYFAKVEHDIILPKAQFIDYTNINHNFSIIETDYYKLLSHRQIIITIVCMNDGTPTDHTCPTTSHESHLHSHLG